MIGSFVIRALGKNLLGGSLVVACVVAAAPGDARSPRVSQEQASQDVQSALGLQFGSLDSEANFEQKGVGFRVGARTVNSAAMGDCYSDLDCRAFGLDGGPARLDATWSLEFVPGAELGRVDLAGTLSFPVGGAAESKSAARKFALRATTPDLFARCKDGARSCSLEVALSGEATGEHGSGTFSWELSLRVEHTPAATTFTTTELSPLVLRL